MIESGRDRDLARERPSELPPLGAWCTLDGRVKEQETVPRRGRMPT